MVEPSGTPSGCGPARLAAQPDIILTSAFNATWVGFHSQSFIYPSPLIITCAFTQQVVNTNLVAAVSWRHWKREEEVKCPAPVLQLSCVLILMKDQKPGQLKYLVVEHRSFFCFILFFMLTQ